MVAITVARVRALAVGASLLLGGVAEAGSFDSTASTRASASIIAPEAAPQLVRAGAGSSTAALDGQGRALSVSVPTKILLRGSTPGDAFAARPMLAPAGAGIARLMLTPDRPLRRVAAGGGAYVGELSMSLDYN
jgi:hypothetical protein